MYLNEKKENKVKTTMERIKLEFQNQAKAIFPKPTDGKYLLLLKTDSYEYRPQILTYCQTDQIMTCLEFYRDGNDDYDALLILSDGDCVLECNVQHKLITINLLRMEEHKNAQGFILDLYEQQSKLIKELKDKVDILSELVDRPDGYGCKFSYEQICNVMS